MAFVILRLRRSILPIRANCQGTNKWQALDGRQYSSEESNEEGNASSEEQRTLAQNRTKHRREEAKQKLNNLLESIEKHRTPVPLGDDVSGRLAWPGARPRPREVVPIQRRTPATGTTASSQPARQLTLDEQVAAAAREVAASLAGDPAQTERDLLARLSGGREQPGAGQANLSELMSGMKLEQQPAARAGRAQHVRYQVGGQRADALRQARRDRSQAAPRAPQPAGGADMTLNCAEMLGTFTALEALDASTVAAEMTPTTTTGQWQRLHARELRLRITHPPTNAWEEMSIWTEQGKLWRLPVDNEHGLGQEAAVGFHEHVFLDGYLEPWCPPRGPVRQFMELVCVALGKNPWQSVMEKREHIDWFREYFAGKQRLMLDLKVV